MECREEKPAADAAQAQPPRDWARLIRKLRWIGLEEEAKELEMAVRTSLPPEQRRGVPLEPINTD